jgi:hypothetical protein
VEELRCQGLSLTAIGDIPSFDRKKVRKYLLHPELEALYKP